MASVAARRAAGRRTVTGRPPARSPGTTVTPRPARASCSGPIGRRRSGGAPSIVIGPVASAARAVTKRDVVPASPASSVTSCGVDAPAASRRRRASSASPRRCVDADAERSRQRTMATVSSPSGQAAQAAVAVGERGAHERPVGDALGAGHVDDGVERARRGGEAEDLGHRRQLRRVTAGRKPRAMQPAAVQVGDVGGHEARRRRRRCSRRGGRPRSWRC